MNCKRAFPHLKRGVEPSLVRAMRSGAARRIYDLVSLLKAGADVAKARRRGSRRCSASTNAWIIFSGGCQGTLERSHGLRLGFPVSLPMRRIVLEVNSALDGVGLTAAVSAALGAESIPCNMVAAYHHDHVFAPSAMAERALAILKALQAEAVGQR